MVPSARLAQPCQISVPVRAILIGVQGSTLSDHAPEGSPRWASCGTRLICSPIQRSINWSPTPRDQSYERPDLSFHGDRLPGRIAYIEERLSTPCDMVDMGRRFALVSVTGEMIRSQRIDVDIENAHVRCSFF